MLISDKANKQTTSAGNYLNSWRLSFMKMMRHSLAAVLLASIQAGRAGVCRCVRVADELKQMAAVKVRVVQKTT